MRFRWLVSLTALALAAGVTAAGPAFASPGHQAAAPAAHPGWRIGGPLVPGPGAPRAVGQGVTSSSSHNWSGYAVTGGTFTTVTANWTLGAVTCPSSGADAAPWIGIDGDGSGTVEQTGTDAMCNSKNPTYVAWYEMYPSAPVFLTDPVKAGDHFTGTVTHTSGTSYTLTLADTTQGWTNKTTQSLSAKNISAEAIVEKAASKLSDFGTDSFTGFKINGKPASAFKNAPFTLNRIHLINSSGATCDKVSPLSGGDNFTVTWKNAC